MTILSNKNQICICYIMIIFYEFFQYFYYPYQFKICLVLTYNYFLQFQSNETMDLTGAESDQNSGQSQVISYTAPWTIFALGFSNKPQYPFRLGIASFVAETKNEIQIIQLGQQRTFQKKASFEHNYPPTKLLWMPDESGSKPDLLATSGQSLKIWKVTDNKEVSLSLNLQNQNQFSAPLTSFDWNPEMPNLLGTSSIDTTCTIWDIEKVSVYTQLIAHDKQVYDIHFSKEKDIFASVGADGSVRQFDIRDLKHSSVLYETQRSKPILKLAWNRRETKYLAIIEMQQTYITLLDSRKPSVALCKLQNHKDYVNAIAWAPQSAVHICSVGDDCKAYIWDLNNQRGDRHAPLLEYRADDQVSNLSWSNLQKEWLAITFVNQLQILRL